MILLDTGPLVAVANRSDQHHESCVGVLRSMTEPLMTTVSVLTEALYLLSPGSNRAARLMDFVAAPSIQVWFLNDASLQRCFQLMLRYADCPMGLADATLVACAEQKQLDTIFTLDQDHFSTYRIKRGHRHVPFEVIP